MRRAAVALVTVVTMAMLMPASAQAGTGQVALIAENEGLYAYNIDHPERSHLIIPTLDSQTPEHPSQYVNGPPCFIPGDEQGRFVEADDNPNETWNGGTENGDAHAFFGVFDTDGSRDMNAHGDHDRIGAEAGMQDPAGCAFDPVTKNLFGVDVGFNHAPFMGDGQLIEFFAPDYTTWCVLDNTLSQPGMIAFDDQGGLLVPQAGFGQVDRYSGFPANASNCAGTQKNVWMYTIAEGIGTPIGITRAPDGGWALASVFAPPAIYHLTYTGVVDGVIAAPSVDPTGALGLGTGTPFGLAYDSRGDLFYADLGVRPFPLDGTDPTDPIDSASKQGSLREVVKGAAPIGQLRSPGWDFPDGVTVVRASAID